MLSSNSALKKPPHRQHKHIGLRPPAGTGTADRHTKLLGKLKFENASTIFGEQS